MPEPTNNKPDGGAAFPNLYTLEQGMTLRDYFAAMAMQGLIVNYKRNNDKVNDEHPWVHEKAYQVADAMIAERGKA